MFSIHKWLITVMSLKYMHFLHIFAYNLPNYELIFDDVLNYWYDSSELQITLSFRKCKNSSFTVALFITRFARPVSICRIFLRDWICQKASHWWILAQMRRLTEVFMAHGHPWPNQSKWLFSWSQQSEKK